MTYEQFAHLVQEGRTCFIGRSSEYLLSARIVVERMFPDRIGDFEKRFQ